MSDLLKAYKFIGETKKAILDRNIERGRLAQVWLDKAKSATPQLIDEVLWTIPDREEQEAVTKFLVDDGLISDEEWGFSYIEPQCIEHGVLHVYVCDGTGVKRVLCVHPGSGRVETC